MDVNDLEPKMTMKLSNLLSKNTHLSQTHSMIKHHGNNQEQDDNDDDDHREKMRKKKKKGWSFLLKNKLSSKISTLFGKISKGNRSPSSTHKSNNSSNQHDHDDVKEKQGKPTTVGEIMFNGTRTTTSGGGGDGRKMGMNRSRSLKRGVVVVKKAKVKEMMVLERKQSMRRNGNMNHHHHHHHHVEEGEELCKKRILMGFRCKPIYDQNGVMSLD